MGKHKKCVYYFGQTLYWDKNTTSCQGKICEFANAYILWRMYFEDLSHPIMLFKKHKRTINNSNVLKYYRLGYPDALVKRIFILECFWIFYECLLWAYYYSRNDLYSFLVENIVECTIPFWIVDIVALENRGYVFDLYYWIDIEMLKFAKNSTNCFKKKCKKIEYNVSVTVVEIPQMIQDLIRGKY